MSGPQLLRVPKSFRSIDEILATASKMNLTNIVILSQREDGSVVFLHDDAMTVAATNWLLDTAKHHILITPVAERLDR